MIKRFFGNYNEFKCIADKCPATCCSGWAIEVDDESLDKYEATGDKRLLNEIDYESQCFRQQSGGDCAFLRSDGLCRMYIDFGEDYLCNTCDMYPRHIEEFPGVREYSLSVSCPVAAEWLLKQEAPVAYSEAGDDIIDEEDYEDFNEDLYDTLVASRCFALELIQSRNISYAHRSLKLVKAMQKLQEMLDDGEPYNVIREWINSCRQETGSLSSGEDSFDIDNTDGSVDSVFMKFFDLLLELDPLKSEFMEFAGEAGQLLNPEVIRAFEAAHSMCDTWCEQIATYFTFTYLCGAVYDDYVYSMGILGVYSSFMVKYLWAAKWAMVNVDRNGKRAEPLTLQELSEVLYGYCRELEHSTDNMILLEQLLNDNMPFVDRH